MSINRKPFFPQKTFDDDLAALVEMFVNRSWAFTNIDVAALTKDVEDQRKERTAFTNAESDFLAAGERFARAQAARHRRFAAALNAARGAFRDDPEVLKELSLFKRSIRRKKASSEDETTEGQATVGRIPA